MTSQQRTLRIGPIDVHFPDATDATFWFMHDLAGIFGLETNAEAEATLRASIEMLGEKSRREIDHEADYVFLHARKPEGLLAALRAVEHAAGRPLYVEGELERARVEMAAWKRPKPVPYSEGDLLAVPLMDGTYGVIHTLAAQVFLVLDARAASVNGLREALAMGAGVPIGGRSFSDHEILNGEWPIAGRRSPESSEQTEHVFGGKTSGGSVVGFLESFFGLRPWDSMFDCDEHDEWLLPGVIAGKRRLRRDIFNAQLRVLLGDPARRAEVGEATIHLTIAYKGGGRPRVIDKPKIRGVADRLRPVSQGLWTGGGDGFFDVFARVPSVEALRVAVDQAAVESRIKDDILLECYAPFDVDWDSHGRGQK